MKSRFQYRNRFIAVIGALQMAFLAPAAAGNKPNVMFIFADDHSYEALAAHGNSEVKTPNLDRLVGLGVSFTHCYNMGSWSGAVCVASRAMLNSGRFVNRAQVGLSQFPHWSELMHDAGYTTYMTGKWHVRGEPRFDVVKDVRGGMPNQTKAGYNRPLNEGHYKIGWKPWDPQMRASGKVARIGARLSRTTRWSSSIRSKRTTSLSSCTWPSTRLTIHDSRRRSMSTCIRSIPSRCRRVFCRSTLRE